MDLGRLPPEALAKFIEDVLADRVFTAHHLNPADFHLIPMLFMPLAFIEKENRPPSEQIGTVYAPYTDAIPRALNGYAIFSSVAFLHVEDWKLASEEIRRDQLERVARDAARTERLRQGTAKDEAADG